MAIGALRYCRAQGIDVSGDVSVAGFDDMPFADLISPALTTGAQPARDMGYAAARLLFFRLRGHHGEPVVTDPEPLRRFDVQVRICESAAPPSR